MRTLPPEQLTSAVMPVLAKTGGSMLQTVHVLVRNSNNVMVNSISVAVSSNNVASNSSVANRRTTGHLSRPLSRWSLRSYPAHSACIVDPNGHGARVSRSAS